jgi:hypothetical protein
MTTYNLYRDGVQVLHDVTFNHAVGALYRSQYFEGETIRGVPVGRFQIERELRGGGCSHPAFHGLYAIANVSNIEATSVPSTYNGPTNDNYANHE